MVSRFAAGFAAVAAAVVGGGGGVKGAVAERLGSVSVWTYVLDVVVA